MLITLATISIFTSCQKEIKNTEAPNENIVFPTTDQQKQTVATVKEVSQILKEVYKNRTAFYEACATIYSGYYNDESVLLKDLLFPEKSPIYKMEKFKSFKVKDGAFKEEFLKVFNKGSYPNLIKAFGISASSTARAYAVAPTDTSMEIFSNSNGVMIYFPYSENFGSNFTPAYFDNVNTDPYGVLATIVSADREADSGPGDEPYMCFADETFTNMTICYRPVIVDDAYAEGKITHIVGTGAGPSRILPSDPPPSTNINRVFNGWTRIYNKRQYDKLIGFNSQNSGGSEIKICRISGYLQFENQQVTNFSGDQYEVNFKRSEINRGKWKRVYGVWDADWVPHNHEQVMAVYEEDNEGTQTFTGNLTTTVNVGTQQGSGGSATATRTLGYSITVKTQDELPLQEKFSRTAYFGAAKSDHAWGFQMCDTRGGTCRYDETFLPVGQYWPIYNGGANWNYTWPYNSY